MAALWDGQPLTAAQVAERIGPERGWTLATVKTLLSRLTAKGAVATEEDGRRFLYRPLVARDAYAAAEGGRIIDRLFGGRVTPLVAQMAEAGRLTPQDLAEIEALIAKLKS